MTKFWLIQTGRVTTSVRNNPFAPKNIINNVQLDYMGAAEFEWGALPKSLARMMHHFVEYSAVHTGIRTPDGDEVILFCKKDAADLIVNMLKEYLECPYELKGLTPLKPEANMFWWGIDYIHLYASYPKLGKDYSDWMACTSSDYELMRNGIDAANETWMMMSDTERQELYTNATR